VTLRALATLAEADAVLAEDKRVSKRLLAHYGIATPLEPYHEHNAERVRPGILARLREGARIALVSDAGTPLISDPGFKLVREASSAGFSVVALPGPSSVLAALSVAALPTNRFFFEGFLPPKQAARRARLTELARLDATLVLFESGSRVQETLADLAAIMGARDAAICREMTKLHEEIKRSTLAGLAQSAATLETRGEFVLVIGPQAEGSQAMTADEVDNLLRERLARDSVKDAVAHAVEVSGRPRREIYARALELAKSAHGEN
jgi:16S rRNA (cytidine1402-2'-O)-methyltransferase